MATEGEETPLYGNSEKEGEKNDSSEGKDDLSAVDKNDDSSECKPESSKADDDLSNEKTADESSVNPDESPAQQIDESSAQQSDESSPPKIERLTSEEDFPPPPAPEEFGQEQLNGDDVQGLLVLLFVKLFTFRSKQTCLLFDFCKKKLKHRFNHEF